MRILQVIHDFIPRHVAGSQLYCYYLSCALAARRHSVHVFFTEFDSSRRQYSYRRSMFGPLTCHEVVHNHEYRSFEETYRNRQMDERFERLLDAERPDVVHLHHLQHHSVNYTRLARQRGIPVVFTLHDYWLSCLRYGQRLHPAHGVCDDIDTRRCADCVSEFPIVPPVVGALRRALLRARRRSSSGSPDVFLERTDEARLARMKAIYRALMKRLAPAAKRAVEAAQRLDALRAACRDVDLFLAPSEFLAGKMTEFGLPAERVVHSCNGMRTDLVQIHRERRDGRIRFGYVGMVAPHKGVHVLVDAFASLAARHQGRPIELRIHGSLSCFPAYVAQLRAQAGTAPVAFLGAFDNSRADEIYAGLDALVIPSTWWENAPLTLVEARLAGRPVIVSDGGSLPNLIDAHDLAFRNGDAGDLARCLAAFVDRPQLGATVARIRPVKTIAEDARDLEQRYAGLIAARSTAYPRAAASDARP
jgi:glycosyltransferase involved in cell wall biosynthesis